MLVEAHLRAAIELALPRGRPHRALGRLVHLAEAVPPELPRCVVGSVELYDLCEQEKKAKADGEATARLRVRARVFLLTL